MKGFPPVPCPCLGSTIDVISSLGSRALTDTKLTSPLAQGSDEEEGMTNGQVLDVASSTESSLCCLL